MRGWSAAVAAVCLVSQTVCRRADAMGVLTVGTPLSWSQAMPHLRYVREHGVHQFINRYYEVKDICNDQVGWVRGRVCCRGEARLSIYVCRCACVRVFLCLS